MNDAPKVSRYDASARGAVTACQNCAHVIEAVFKNVPPNGINTSKLRYSSVKPIAKPKPGSTLRCLKAQIIVVLDFFNYAP